MRFSSTVVMLAAISFGVPAHAQQLYSWTDADGRKHYSDRPPQPDATATPPSAVSTKDQALLDRFQTAMSAGKGDAAIAEFRYFEEVVGAEDARIDRAVIGFFFDRVQEEFGRPGSFEDAPSPSRAYISARIESASSDQWNASSCLFKTYVRKTTFSLGETRRPAEVALSVCTGPGVEPALRQVEIRFTSPDAATANKTQTILVKTMTEARRLSPPAR